MRVLAALAIEGEPRVILFSGCDALKDWNYWGRRIASHQQSLATRAAKPRRGCGISKECASNEVLRCRSCGAVRHSDEAGAQNILKQN